MCFFFQFVLEIWVVFLLNDKRHLYIIVDTLWFCYIQQVYQAKEVTESNPQIKQALCATIIDTDRVCLGTEDGLFCIELMKESKYLF